MKRVFASALILLVLLMPIFSATASDARNNWKGVKENNKALNLAYKEAQQTYQTDNTLENEQALIDAGKDVLNGALNEVEAWLRWQKLKSDEDSNVPNDLKNVVEEDVNKNIIKINDLRAEVDGVTTRIELGIVWIKMVGKYFELITDVARDSGKAWVVIANKRADKIQEFEEKLRNAAENIDDNSAIIQELDDAKAELEKARENINNAETAYNEVNIGGKPLIKFSEGNQYINSARLNLLDANINLRQAFKEILQKRK